MASGTLAWLSKTQTAEGIYTALSDFEVSGTLYFGDSDTPYQPAKDSVLVPVSFNSGDDNYIGNMRYVVRYSGISPAYIRVRVVEQWIDIKSNEVIPVTFLKYNVPLSGDPSQPDPTASPTPSSIPAAGPNQKDLANLGEWIDNRSKDYCYYYSVPVQPKSLVDQSGVDGKLGNGTVELTLFDKTTDPSFLEGIDPSTTKMELLIEVQAVQPNRFREFWGIDAYPTPAPTLTP